MGLEERNGRLYYYRKERDGNRVRSVYVGSGPLARWAADMMEEEQWLGGMKRRRLASVREEDHELSEAYRTLARYVRVNVAAALTLENYRRHKRVWRRRRYPLAVSQKTMSSKKLPEANTPASITYRQDGMLQVNIEATESSEEIRALIDRCGSANPEETDLALLRAWMERDGVMIRAEELARSVHLQAVALYENGLAEEAVLAGVKDLVKRMGYEEADTVEQLLILQVGSAWLILQREQKHLLGVTTGTYGLQEAEAIDKRVSRADNRFNRAVATLEKVRALRRMTEANKRPRMLREHERQALPPHRGDGFFQPTDARVLAVAKT